MTPSLLGHPRPLATLFCTELWERFSYYGMRALLILFLTLPAARAGLGLSDRRAALIYGTYTMSVYLMGIPGGAIADSLLGARRAVLVGAVLIALGHFSLALPAVGTFYLGLCLVAVGTGLLKPNVSAMVGNLYPPGDTRRDAGFSIFYMGINAGAIAGPIATGFLAQHTWFKARLAAWGFDPALSWHWGFGAAGVGMLFGLAGYLAFGRALEDAGPRPAPAPGRWAKPIIALVGTLGLWLIVWLSDKTAWHGMNLSWIRWLFIAIPAVLALGYGRSSDVEKRRFGAIFVLFLGAVAFWAVFEQMGSSLNLFADRYTRPRLLGIEFPSSWYQAVEGLFVVILAVAFSALWTRMGPRQPSSPVKFACGLALLAASFGLMVPAARLAADGRVSPFWLIGLYFLQAAGELCLSPVGLSTFTRLSPRRLVGAMMGLWFLAGAIGNKFAGVLAGGFGAGGANGLASFFGQQALAVAAVAVLFFVLSPWVRRLMADSS